jgi:hypothetical protein
VPVYELVIIVLMRVWGTHLGNFVVRLRLAGMNHINEFDGILDEEDWNVVADKIPISLIGIELESKPSDIANGIC